MNGREVLRIVDAIHRDKNIDKEIVFEGVEQAILSAARKHFGEGHELAAHIDRETGEPSVICDGKEIEPDVLGEILGRIAAQTAKQVMIQKIREAERDALYEEYSALRGHIVTGTVKRIDRATRTAYVDLGKVEAILPAGEQIPGETHRVGGRVRSIIIDVKKSGSRVKVILSRTHPEFIVRLFEMEIPEVAEGIIEIKSLAREAGHRTKVAVSCYDPNVDAVGACVGVRGSRIKSIVDELHGERVDIVRWNDSLQVLVPNAMQPAEVEDVILCPMLGRVIVLVREDQLSQAIGKRGQNVRLASKLVGWDIEVMTREELDEQLDRSVAAFASIPGVSEELAENLVAQGFFSFYDLSVIEPEDLAELGGLTPEECDRIIEYADREAMREEEEAKRREEEALRREEEAAVSDKATGRASGKVVAEEKTVADTDLHAAEKTEPTEAVSDLPAGETAVEASDSSDEAEAVESGVTTDQDEPGVSSSEESAPGQPSAVTRSAVEPSSPSVEQPPAVEESPDSEAGSESAGLAAESEPGASVSVEQPVEQVNERSQADGEAHLAVEIDASNTTPSQEQADTQPDEQTASLDATDSASSVASEEEKPQYVSPGEASSAMNTEIGAVAPGAERSVADGNSSSEEMSGAEAVAASVEAGQPDAGLTHTEPPAERPKSSKPSASSEGTSDSDRLALEQMKGTSQEEDRQIGPSEESAGQEEAAG